MQKDKYDNCISLIDFVLIFHKTKRISIMLILHWYLRLARRRGCERVNTIQHEQYEDTVHLFIGTGRSPSKITFIPLNAYLQASKANKVYLVFYFFTWTEPMLSSFGILQRCLYTGSSSWEAKSRLMIALASLCIILPKVFLSWGPSVEKKTPTRAILRLSASNHLFLSKSLQVSWFYLQNPWQRFHSFYLRHLVAFSKLCLAINSVKMN
jgi:hypothetical protein